LATGIAGNSFKANAKRFTESGGASFGYLKGKALAKQREREKDTEVIEEKEFQGMKEE
jgi:hypothetical protein